MSNTFQNTNKQDDYLKRNISNMVFHALNHHYPKFSSFLDERQVLIVTNTLNSLSFKNYVFYGGAENCTRLMLGVFPIEQEPELSFFPIVPVGIINKSNQPLLHKDYLGALMGLQIKREFIGDIVLNNNTAIVLVKSDIAEFIHLNLVKVGRISVEVISNYDEPIVKVQEYEEITGTVSSLRLDCVISLITKKSRAIASDFITTGLVKVNYEEVLSVSKVVKPKDIITIRGKGKYLISEQITKTKKDRLSMIIYKYI